MTKDGPVKVEGKHAAVLNVLVWVGAATGFAALIYCVNGGNIWVTLGAALIGVGLTGGGVVGATKGAAADVAHAARRSSSAEGLSTVARNAPKPPELAQI